MSIQEKALNSSYLQFYKNYFDKYKLKNQDVSNWEYKFHKKQYDEALEKEIKILKGDLLVIYENIETGKYTEDEKYENSDYERWEFWQIKNKASTMWDKQNVSLMGQSVGKSSIMYKYIPSELTENSQPIFLGWENCYDGGKKQQEGIKKGDKTISWEELKTMFPNRQFE